MKKIFLAVMHELTIGGAEGVICNILNNLDREKFDIHLCLFKKKGTLIETLKKDVVIHDLKASRVITGGHKLFSLTSQLKPDIVFSSITHVNLLIAAFIPLLRPFCKNTKFITREVNIPSIRAKYIPKSKRLDYFYRRVIHNFDAVIAQSNYMKEDIHKSYNVDSRKIFVINNPLNIKQIQKTLLKDRTDEQLFNPDKINILAVGVLRRQKGFDILLKVMPLLSDKYHLNIIGEGKERNLLEAMILELDISEKVTFLGFQKNPYKYMRDADINVLSSRYEGFPNVILEANACGKFVVAFACPGVSEEIIHNNVNGFLVEPGNYRALAAAIKKYSKISYDENVVFETTKRYEVKSIVKEYERIFLQAGRD